MEHLRFNKIIKNGTRLIEVDPARITGLIGGPVSSAGQPTFQLELTNRTQKVARVPCVGSVSALQAEFNQHGPKDFLFFTAVLDPLPNLRAKNLQLSAVRIGRIAIIEPNIRYRKAHSIIKRSGLPDVLARESVTELAQRLMQQGFASNGMPDPARFILHPQHQEAPPPVPAPRRKAKLGNPFTGQERLF
jgi:hypothetical protein